MGHRSPPYRVRIRGDLACFTRPEFKSERVSYEVITPSAARGILEAILWKPAIRWHIDKIEILAPIRFTTFRRNEVEGKIPVTTAKSAMKGNSTMTDFVVNDQRQQRNTLALVNVDYVITCHFTMTADEGPGDNPTKFEAMFERRLRKGQSFHQPYLGCREFPARFEPADQTPPPISETKPLGLMLYDMDYRKTGKKVDIQPLFFPAIMERGVVDVPSWEEVAARGGRP